MITVKAIYTAPVKSLALQQLSSVYVGPRGISGDRHFYLVDDAGKLLTQRELGKLVQVQAEYSGESEHLRLSFPDGEAVGGPVIRGKGIGTRIWDRRVKGHLIEGDWHEALSQFCGQPIHLVEADEDGQAFDEFPVSIVSQASLDRLSQESEGASTFEGPRFRPNLLLEGCRPHEEDEWLSGLIQIGSELRLQPIMPDPRCAIVTQNPTTGERDADTLRLIMRYRPSVRNAYFGVYAIVAQPGTVSVGDEGKVLRTSSPQPT